MAAGMGVRGTHPSRLCAGLLRLARGRVGGPRVPRRLHLDAGRLPPGVLLGPHLGRHRVHSGHRRGLNRGVPAPGPPGRLHPLPLQLPRPRSPARPDHRALRAADGGGGRGVRLVAAPRRAPRLARPRRHPRRDPRRDGLLQLLGDRAHRGHHVVAARPTIGAGRRHAGRLAASRPAHRDAACADAGNHLRCLAGVPVQRLQLRHRDGAGAIEVPHDRN